MLQAYSPGRPLQDEGFDSRMPAHFYGELAKTAEGVELLLEKGHFARNVDLLDTHWHEDEDAAIIQKVKAALWAIGSVGATERGAPFLKQCQVMRTIVKIAEESLVATLKGTAYLVLGMLSSTTVGMALLENYRWQGVKTNMGSPTGICVPDQVSNVLNYEPWQQISGTAASDYDAFLKEDPLSNEILRAMSDLSNHIVANEAARTLIR